MLSLNEDGVILKIFSFISLLYWTAFMQIKKKKYNILVQIIAII